MFRASSFEALDADDLDSIIEAVLGSFFGVPWAKSTQESISAHPRDKLRVLACSVSVAGLVNQEITVSVLEGSCSELVDFLGMSGLATCQDVLAELANTIAGHLKVALADGLSTGIPQAGYLVVTAQGDATENALGDGHSSPEASFSQPACSVEPRGYRGVFSRGDVHIEVDAGG